MLPARPMQGIAASIIALDESGVVDQAAKQPSSAVVIQKSAGLGAGETSIGPLDKSVCSSKYAIARMSSWCVRIECPTGAIPPGTR